MRQTLIITEQSGTNPEQCEICDELSGGDQNAFASRYLGATAERIIWQSDHLTIVPTIGQIVPGHVMIIPKTHITAFADASPEALLDLSNAKERLRKILLRKHGGCIFFEHGTRSQDLSGCGIYHAHMHAVPIAYSSTPTNLVHGIHFADTVEFGSPLFKVSPDASYVFFENSVRRCFVAEVVQLPSQILRKAVAQLANNSRWDWREYGFEPGLLDTLKNLRTEFS